MKQIALFKNVEGHKLTIAAVKGKSGYNLKVSVKTSREKGSPKAITGCRASFDNAAEAQETFDMHVADAEKRGWKRIPKVTRNAFTTIPNATATKNEAWATPSKEARRTRGAKKNATPVAVEPVAPVAPEQPTA